LGPERGDCHPGGCHPGDSEFLYIFDRSMILYMK